MAVLLGGVTQVGDLAEFELATYVRLRSLRQETAGRDVFRPLKVPTLPGGVTAHGSQPNERRNNSNSGRGGLMHPPIQWEINKTKPKSRLPSENSPVLFDSKGRYHAHALVAWLTAEHRESTGKITATGERMGRGLRP